MKYGRLTIVGEPFLKYPLPTSKQLKRYIKTICECRTEKDCDYYSVKYGKIQSCGCLNRELSGNRARKHGLSQTPLYAVWFAMLERCRNPLHEEYHRYGAKGVEVCDEWKDNPKPFIDWALANGYNKGLQIDRFPNNEGNYEPGNCRFATPKENSRNKRNGILDANKVFIIRNLWRMGAFTQKELAGIYHVSKSSIGHITTNRSWL